MLSKFIYADPVKPVITVLVVIVFLIAGFITSDLYSAFWLPVALAAEANQSADDGTDEALMGSIGPQISIDVKSADLRDVLSALAIKMDINVVMMDSKAQPVTFQAKNIPCGKALDLIIRSKGLSYVKEGNIVIVGTQDMLPKDVFEQTILTRFETYYIAAAKLKGLIEQLSIPDVKVLTVDTNPHAIWVQGTAKSLQKVRELVYAVDIEENAENTEKPEALNYREIKTENISSGRALEILNAGLPDDMKIKRYVKLQNILVVFDQNLFKRWDLVENLIKDFDFKGAESQTVYVHQLSNVVVGDAAQWLQQFDFAGEIKVVAPNNYDRFNQQITVICPPALVKQVRDALVQLDQPKKSVKVPVLTYKGEHGNTVLNAKKSLLSELTGISQYKMHVSKNIGTTDNPEYVLWVEEAPNKIKQIRDMLDEIKKNEESESSDTE
jgi:type IV pilus assembly protein PilQ